MEYRQLGRSGLRVSALTLGTMTFGGRGGFRAVGATDVVSARRQVDMCLDAGINLIDTADVYSGRGDGGDHRRGDHGAPGLPPGSPPRSGWQMGDGTQRCRACPGSHHLRLRGEPAQARHRPHRHLSRARVGRADPAGGDPVRAGHARSLPGKVRYLAASNYAGWQLMKALAAADHRGFERFAAQQVYYSLESRDAEYELVPPGGRPGTGHPGVVPAGRRGPAPGCPVPGRPPGARARTRRPSTPANSRPAAPRTARSPGGRPPRGPSSAPAP